LFSPLAFPDGVVLYDFTTTVSSPSHLTLSPFEMFREPLIVLGIADSREFDFGPAEPPNDADTNESRIEIVTAIHDIKEEYSRTLVQKILLFDAVASSSQLQLHQDIIFVPPAKELKTTTLRTMMCDITSRFLAEMTTLAISIKALPSIASPSTNQPGSNGIASSQWYEDDSPTLSRTLSQNAETSRSSSPAINNLHRQSMPVFPSSSPSLDDHVTGSPPISPETGRNTPPPKTFEDMASGELGAAGFPGSRPVSATVSREHSRDRVSVHGFGPGSINERNRNKGKARVGLVIGSLYLQSGRWHDALRELAEGAAKARSFSDHLWHAKALENIAICMILLAWAGADFKVLIFHGRISASNEIWPAILTVI
jgi:hypothetical protein